MKGGALGYARQPPPSQGEIRVQFQGRSELIFGWGEIAAAEQDFSAEFMDGSRGRGFAQSLLRKLPGGGHSFIEQSFAAKVQSGFRGGGRRGNRATLAICWRKKGGQGCDGQDRSQRTIVSR